MDSTIALWLVDTAILITLLEGAALAWWHRRTGRGIPPRRLFCNLAAGLALMAALRAALAGDGWPWVAAGLMLAGVAHAIDQIERWRQATLQRRQIGARWVSAVATSPDAPPRGTLPLLTALLPQPVPAAGARLSRRPALRRSRRSPPRRRCRAGCARAIARARPAA